MILLMTNNIYHSFLRSILLPLFIILTACSPLETETQHHKLDTIFIQLETFNSIPTFGNDQSFVIETESPEIHYTLFNQSKTTLTNFLRIIGYKVFGNRSSARDLKIRFTYKDSNSIKTIQKHTKQLVPNKKGYIQGETGKGYPFEGYVLWDHEQGIADFYGQVRYQTAIRGTAYYDRQKAKGFLEGQVGFNESFEAKMLKPQFDHITKKEAIEFLGTDDAGRQLNGFIETQYQDDHVLSEEVRQKIYRQELRLSIHPFLSPTGNEEAQLYHSTAVYEGVKYYPPETIIPTMLEELLNIFPGPGDVIQYTKLKVEKVPHPKPGKKIKSYEAK